MELIPNLSEDGVRRAGVVERVLRWVPVAGWLIASMLEQRRFAVAEDKVDRVLRSRAADDVRGEWCTQGYNYQKAYSVAQIIARECRWPNAHFLPGDSMSGILIGDEGQFLGALEQIEDELLLLRGTFARRLTNFDGTFGQFVCIVFEYSGHVAVQGEFRGGK